MNWEIDLQGRNIEGYKDDGGAGGGIGQCAPATGGSVRGLGMGGIPMKKKVWPKETGKLKEKVGWKKSFNYGTPKGKKKI